MTASDCKNMILVFKKRPFKNAVSSPTSSQKDRLSWLQCQSNSSEDVRLLNLGHCMDAVEPKPKHGLQALGRFNFHSTVPKDRFACEGLAQVIHCLVAMQLFRADLKSIRSRTTFAGTGGVRHLVGGDTFVLLQQQEILIGRHGLHSSAFRLQGLHVHLNHCAVAVFPIKLHLFALLFQWKIGVKGKVPGSGMLKSKLTCTCCFAANPSQGDRKSSETT